MQLPARPFRRRPTSGYSPDWVEGDCRPASPVVAAPARFLRHAASAIQFATIGDRRAAFRPVCVRLAACPKDRHFPACADHDFPLGRLPSMRHRSRFRASAALQIRCPHPMYSATCGCAAQVRTGTSLPTVALQLITLQPSVNPRYAGLEIRSRGCSSAVV